MDTQANDKKIYIWVGVGCLVLVACILAVIVFGFGGLLWIGSQSPDNAAIKVDVPINSNVDDNVEINIAITNTSAESIKLVSVDISQNYLDGFTIVQSDPPFIEAYQFDNPLTHETFQTYNFDQMIEPDNTLVIVMEGSAILTGDFSGNIDVCIDSTFNCSSNIIRTVIE
jgi:hypothetical protein